MSWRQRDDGHLFIDKQTNVDENEAEHGARVRPSGPALLATRQRDKSATVANSGSPQDIPEGHPIPITKRRVLEQRSRPASSLNSKGVSHAGFYAQTAGLIAK